MTVGKYEYSEEPHIITRTEIGDVEFNNTVLKIASQAARKHKIENKKRCSIRIFISINKESRKGLS